MHFYELLFQCFDTQPLQTQTKQKTKYLQLVFTVSSEAAADCVELLAHGGKDGLLVHFHSQQLLLQL